MKANTIKKIFVESCFLSTKWEIIYKNKKKQKIV